MSILDHLRVAGARWRERDARRYPRLDHPAPIDGRLRGPVSTAVSAAEVADAWSATVAFLDDAVGVVIVDDDGNTVRAVATVVAAADVPDAFRATADDAVLVGDDADSDVRVDAVGVPVGPAGGSTVGKQMMHAVSRSDEVWAPRQ